MTAQLPTADLRVAIMEKAGPVALIDMTLPQLEEAYTGLDRLEREYENMSGICATLKGMVLIEAKAKLGHGNYRAWLKEHFPKSVKTAERYKRLAEAFGKSDSTVAFQTLTRDLADSVAALREFQLDLSHPIVAKVALWVKGRGAFQLMLELGPGSLGGDTSGHRKKLTPAEAEKQFLAAAKEDFETALMSLDRIHDKRIWQAPSVTDSMLEQSIELAREFAREAAAWLRTPKRERSIPPAESFAS